MIYQDEAVVIRSVDYGEGNKIITLFTKSWGKVSVMARGAKKIKSRHSAVALLFTYGEYTYYKSGQMGTLNHADVIQSHHNIRQDLHKTAYAAYIVELVYRMLPDHEASAFLFAQLVASLQGIEDDKDAQIITHLFEMKMLGISGYSPELNACVSCSSVGDHPFFSVSLGGLLCVRCKTQDPSAMPVTLRSLKLLRLFQQVDLRRLGNIDVSPETKTELKQLMRQFMDNHVSSHWKSRNFLDQMEKYNL